MNPRTFIVSRLIGGMIGLVFVLLLTL